MIMHFSKSIDQKTGITAFETHRKYAVHKKRTPPNALVEGLRDRQINNRGINDARTSKEATYHNLKA